MKYLLLLFCGKFYVYNLYVCKWHTNNKIPYPPFDSTIVLTLQHQQHSIAIWEGNDLDVNDPTTLSHEELGVGRPREAVGSYCQTAWRLSFREREDRSLHGDYVGDARRSSTFHIPVGGATIMLQDVAILLGFGLMVEL